VNFLEQFQRTLTDGKNTKDKYFLENHQGIRKGKLPPDSLFPDLGTGWSKLVNTVD